MTPKRRARSTNPPTDTPRTPSPTSGPSTSTMATPPTSTTTTRDHIISSSQDSGSYAAVADISHRVQFLPGQSSDVIVFKDNAESEFILSGIFQIAHNDFFFTPDGNFDPGNSYNIRFHDAKLSCRLAAPPPRHFPFATTDFPSCINTLHSLEKLIKHEKNDEILSAIIPHLQQPQIKLTHMLFEVSQF